MMNVRLGCRVLVCVGLGLASVVCRDAAAEPALEWRVGPTAWSYRSFSFYEAVDKTASLGMRYIEAYEGQRVRPDSDAKLDAALADEAIEELRGHLKEAGVALTGWRLIGWLAVSQIVTYDLQNMDNIGGVRSASASHWI